MRHPSARGFCRGLTLRCVSYGTAPAHPPHLYAGSPLSAADHGASAAVLGIEGAVDDPQLQETLIRGHRDAMGSPGERRHADSDL